VSNTVRITKCLTGPAFSDANDRQDAAALSYRSKTYTCMSQARHRVCQGLGFARIQSSTDLILILGAIEQFDSRNRELIQATEL
jgi:hypothetical protein